MQANYGYGNQQRTDGGQSTQQQQPPPRSRPLNLRQGAQQRNANVISNPFGSSDMSMNNTNAQAQGLFEQPDSAQEEPDNMFTSDDPAHGGIQMEDSGSNGMFTADAAPPTQQTNPTGRPARSQQIVPPRRAAEPPINNNARRNNVVPPRRPPQVPNANLFAGGQQHQQQNQDFDGHEQSLDSAPSDLHASVEFEDVGFQEDSSTMINQNTVQQNDLAADSSNINQQHRQGDSRPSNMMYDMPFQKDDGSNPDINGKPGFTSYDEEPPILEELGIKPEEIKKKFMAIILQRGFKEVSTYEDMAGAIFVLFLFGLLLLMRGTYQFGNIYGAGSTGCVCIFLMINLLTKKGVYVELYSTISILGYSLLPFCLLAVGSVFLDLHNIMGIAFSLAVIAWSTVTATRFFENSLDMQNQRFLIAYPIFLFYCVFTLLVIF